MLKTLQSVTYNLEATALDAIHHGAGSSGNTSLLRTQEIVLPDGSAAAIPFVSGNSLRHGFRAALADHLLEVVGAQPKSLPKQVVDLLYSGGALTATGANVDLEAIRSLSALVPSLGLLGYSASSTMVQGKLRVQNLHLVCAENAWRLPAWVTASQQAEIRAGAFRGEEFGTRHDAKRAVSSGSYIDWLDPESDASTQMIYDSQVLKPGSVLWTSITGENVTELEAAALKTAFALQAIEQIADDTFTFSVGAKRSLGFGRLLAKVQSEEVVAVDAAYVEHLESNADEIVAALKEAV